MTPVTRTSTRGGELKRQAILEAALELFVERGYHGTAVPAVAEKAGVGAGTIYRYFANKEALVNELFREQKQALTAHVLEGFPTGAPAREQHRAFWQRMSDFARQNPRAFAFLELHSHRDYLDDDSLGVEQGIIDFGTRFFVSAQERGEVNAGSPMLIMSLVFGAFVGMVRASWEGRLELTDDAIATAEALCWKAIAAD